MDPPGVAPGSPACGAGVVLLDHEPVSSPEVRDSRPPARHAPKDLNPDQLGWNQPCCQLHQGRVLCRRAAEAVGLEPTSGSAATCFQDRLLIRPDDFRASTSSGGWNRTNGLLVQSQASLPAATTPDRFPCDTRCVVRSRKLGEKESNPVSWFKARRPAVSPIPDCRHAECPAGIEPACPAWKAGACADRPRARVVKAEGEGVEPSRLVQARPVSSGCHRQLACPSVTRLRRQESNLRRGA